VFLDCPAEEAGLLFAGEIMQAAFGICASSRAVMHSYPQAISLISCLTKPSCRRGETILRRRNYIGVPVLGGVATGGLAMLELTAAFFAAFGASIFVAHAVESYFR
jgi:hypothetical protein